MSIEFSPGPVLILGLGNPGAKYEATRHNVGFMVVKEFSNRLGFDISKSGHHSLWGQTRLGGRKLYAAMPQTYMNLSGRAARSLAAYFDLDEANIMVVCDDLDLDFGRLKVAHKGGAGGHKGLASIISELGTGEFKRLKCGIGRPRHGEPIEKFVLDGFYSDQHVEAEKMVTAATDCLEVALCEGVQAAMQKFHRPIKEVEG